MAYFEINSLLVKHKSYEGIKTVLDIDHLEIQKGETYGIVGESGQGKTVLALTILQLLQTPPGFIEKGEIMLDGEDLLKKSTKQMQRLVRGSKVAMIFQDPMSCMNPVFTVGSTMIDVLRRHNKGMSKKTAQNKAVSLLEEVKLADAESVMAKYPHQLSGGQRQRVIIALALCCGAEFMIADEPTRNLDVTIQASVLKLLKDLQRKHNITVLFIANNMSLVSAFCDKVAILLMNCLEWLPIYFGILKAGAIAVPLNYRYTAEEIKYCLELAEADVLVFGPEFIGRVEEISDRIPGVKQTFYVGAECPTFAESYDYLVKFMRSIKPDVEITDDDNAAIYFSSG